MNFVFISAILFIAVFSLCNAFMFDYAVLKTESTSSSNDLCVYAETSASLPKQISEAEPHFLEIGSVIDWCTNDSKGDASDKVLVLASGNCSLQTQVRNFHSMGGKFILFVASSELSINENLSDTSDFYDSKYLNETEIPTLVISEDSANILKEMGEIITVKLFQPSGKHHDYLRIILEVITVVTATIGSYMSGLTSYKIFSGKANGQSPTDVEVPVVGGSHVHPRWAKLYKFLAQISNNLRSSEGTGTAVLVLTPFYAVILTIAMIFVLIILYIVREYIMIFIAVSFALLCIFCLDFCLISWTKQYQGYFSKK